MDDWPAQAFVHSEMPTEQIVAKSEILVRRRSRVAVVIGCGCVVDGCICNWSDHVASMATHPDTVGRQHVGYKGRVAIGW